jgi:NitT/TauT family transport system permease protein
VNRSRRIAPFLVPASLAFAWLAIARTAWATHHAIPSPREVIALMLRESRTTTLWLDLGATLARVLAGVVVATIAGATLGIALGRKSSRWRAAEPSVEFLRSIPPILSYPLFLLALGYGESSRIAAVVFGSSGIVLLSVARALVEAPAERRDTVTMAGLSGVDVVTALHAYEALPALFTSVRLATTSALIVVVVSEMLVGAHHGLGARAQTALLEYRADGLWLVILVAGGAHFALSSALVMLERRVVHWNRDERR